MDGRGIGVARVALVAVVAVVLAACGAADEGTVRNVGSESGSASGTGSSSGSGSGSGSATGLSLEETTEATTDDEAILAAIDDYKDYASGQIDEMVADTAAFTDAIRAGDLDEAQRQYTPGRVHWERIEPIAGLIEDIDVAVDARVDDFADEQDPDFTGWHRLEYLLFEEETTDGAAEFADQLDADLASLDEQFADLTLPPAAVALGAAELIEEVSEGKITGEEDRYAHTDLYDFKANVDGSEAVIDSLEAPLEERDPELLAGIRAGFDELNAALDTYRDPDSRFATEEIGGWRLYTELDDADRDQLQAQLAALSEDLALVPGTLGLQ